MSYFVAVQRKSGCIDVVSMKDFDAGIPEGSNTHPEMEKYESLYIPTYFFEFSNGLKDAQMTDFAAKTYCRLNNCRVVSSTKMVKSTFGAEYHGYHPGLGCETRGKEHARRLMNERGLIEIGDSMPKQQKVNNNPITDDVMRDFVQAGANVSDNEAKALVDGTFQDTQN